MKWTALKEDSFQVDTIQSDCCIIELTDIMYTQYGCGGEACISSIDDLDDTYFKMQCSKVFLHNTHLVTNDIGCEIEHIPPWNT